LFIANVNLLGLAKPAPHLTGGSLQGQSSLGNICFGRRLVEGLMPARVVLSAQLLSEQLLQRSNRVDWFQEKPNVLIVPKLSKKTNKYLLVNAGDQEE
jgi:hypothetical protein